MFGTLKLQVSNPAFKLNSCENFPLNINKHSLPLIFRQPARRFASLSLHTEDALPKPSFSSDFTFSVGSSPSSPQLSQWNLTQRHVTVLSVVACAVAVSTTWLFCSAIPTILAFKRAAESLEKLLDVTREELPGTMAAVRLSGMEISDLTMELSDLGQQLTQGVRSSTRAVRVAEERLRQFTDMIPSAFVQEVAKPKAEPAGPLVARTARSIKEGIVKGRVILQIFLTLTWFSRSALNFFANRAKIGSKN